MRRFAELLRRANSDWQPDSSLAASIHRNSPEAAADFASLETRAKLICAG
jgi:hypothetical protein